MTLLRWAALGLWSLTVGLPFNSPVATVAVSLITPVVEVPIPGAEEVLQVLYLETLRCSMVSVNADSAISDGVHNGGIV